MKKKIFGILLICVLVLGLTGCGSSGEKYDKNDPYVEYIELARAQKTGTITDNKTYGELLDAILPDAKWTHYTGYLGNANEEAISCKGKNKNTSEEINVIFVVNLNHENVSVGKYFVNGEEKVNYNLYDLLKEGFEELKKE